MTEIPTTPVIFTIGHSTHPIDEFMALLQAHGVQALADVRTVPKSRHNPQFNSDALAHSLNAAGLEYLHIPKLGGLRRPAKDSPNTGWRNLSFRGYADYIAQPEFEAGLQALLDLANRLPLVIMCVEAVPWRCHRSLIGDALLQRGWQVRDIMTLTSAPAHRPTPFLKVVAGRLLYPGIEQPAP
jgi:uncharacterized protein (DUF488 family)